MHLVKDAFFIFTAKEMVHDKGSRRDGCNGIMGTVITR